MHLKLLISLLLISSLSFSQTGKHVKVPGTKCSIIPPTGFVAATSFSGFQDNESGSSIMIVEIPAPYNTLVEGFTEEGLKSKGMTLVNRKTVDHNNSKATLLHVTQEASGIPFIKYILLFGDDKGTVLVNGIFPEESEHQEEKIKAALFTTSYNSTQNENPLDAAPFTIDIGGSDFKLVRYMSGALLYSTDGKVPTEKPTLIVGGSLSKIPASYHKQYAENRIKKLPGGEKTIIKETREITIDGMKGYEIVADGRTKEGVNELVYQVMVFNTSGDYYIILGHSKENFKVYLDTFRKIANTFRLK